MKSTRTAWRTTWFGAAALVVLLVVAAGVASRSDAGAATPQTLFAAAVPGTPSDPDTSQVELGVKFKAAVAGQVTAVRFYKGTGNTGTHLGRVYSGTGARLSQVTFTSETSSGWQQQALSTPVTVAAGGTYTVSYLAPRGHYADDQTYPWSVTAGDLTGIAGTYRYGGGYPTSTWHASNYYVDLVFAAGTVVTSSSSSSTVSSTSTVASSTVASSTTPTSSPTVTTTSPPPGGFPDSSNTGPGGTALTPYTGPCTLAAGTVIDAKTINCTLVIAGAGVKITRSHINGRVSSDHSGSNSSSSVTIEDSFIDGGQQETFPTVSYDSVTLLRDEVTGGQHSLQCSSACTATDSYLHGQYLPSSSAGHVNAFISNGGHGFVLTHNTLWCSVTQTSSGGGCSGDASLFGDFAAISDATWDRNFFRAEDGPYCVFAGWQPSKPFPVPSNVKITNNVFQRGTAQGQHGFTCAYYGPATSFFPGNGDVFAGNTYDDGAAVTP